MGYRCIKLKVLTFTRMENSKDILKSGLESVELDLKERHIKLGFPATGEWLRTGEVVVEEDGAAIVGKILEAEYTPDIEFGKPPGTLVPITELERWIKAKNARGANIEASPYAIQKSIFKNGTMRFRERGEEFVPPVINEKNLQPVIDSVVANERKIIEAELTGHIKTLF